jgi:hypothetical protein
MRYLKEYAQFGNDSLYEPISYDDYTEFITSKSGWGKPLGFTEVEVNLIKSVLGSEDKFQLLTNGPASKNPQGELISVSGGYYGSWFNKKSSWKVTITKYRDEWFMGQSDKLIDKKSGKKESNLWKCDTIDGVIQLIKDVSSSSMNESVGNSDDYYFEIPKIEMEKIPSKDFMDIDSRVFEMVQSGLSQYIKENCPRVSAKLTRDNWIGLVFDKASEGIVIGGFGYYQSGFEKGKWHPINWMRSVKISQLRDEWFLVSITSSGYSTYFKCDQIDGLMKLLEDYYICESKMVKESIEESLAQKISYQDWLNFQNSHDMLKPDESDYKLYKEFMLDNFTLEEVGNFQNVDYNFGFDWSCEFDELNEEGENYSCGVITIYKFDDEWWVVEHMVKAWHNEYNHWLVDTKEGFKDIKLWD